MKSERCLAAGLNQRKRENKKRLKKSVSCFLKGWISADGKTNIVVAVVIPVVVDIETVLVKVADIDAVAVRIKKIAGFHPCHWKLKLIFIFLFPVFYPGASRFYREPPLKTGKQSNPC